MAARCGRSPVASPAVRSRRRTPNGSPSPASATPGGEGSSGWGSRASPADPVFHFPLPVDSSGWSPPDYAASLVIADRIRPRGETDCRRAGGAPSPARTRPTADAAPHADGGRRHQLDRRRAGRQRLERAGRSRCRRSRPDAGVLLPQGFPGEWNYWVGTGGRSGREGRPAAARASGAAAALAAAGEGPAGPAGGLRRRGGVGGPGVHR